jgi:hypothetical protein
MRGFTSGTLFSVRDCPQCFFPIYFQLSTKKADWQFAQNTTLSPSANISPVMGSCRFVSGEFLWTRCVGGMAVALIFLLFLCAVLIQRCKKKVGDKLFFVLDV